MAEFKGLVKGIESTVKKQKGIAMPMQTQRLKINVINIENGYEKKYYFNLWFIHSQVNIRSINGGVFRIKSYGSIISQMEKIASSLESYQSGNLLARPIPVKRINFLKVIFMLIFVTAFIYIAYNVLSNR